MIYADANATYPVDASHYDLVAEELKRVDGNPSSIHARGREAKVAVEAARANVAALFSARTAEIIFTSGATEANNLVIQGVVNREVYREGGEPPHVVVSAGEHSSVLETVHGLAERGLLTLSIANLTKTGIIDSSSLISVIRPTTKLVVMIHANNETGAISPILDLAASVRGLAPDAHIHVDAVQTFGKYDLSYLASSPTINSAAVSAHKVGGYKGVGALYLKSGTTLARHIFGGGQERARRAGTENVPGIISFGIRAAQLPKERQLREGRMLATRAAWLDILKKIPAAEVHGSTSLEPREQLPNTVNFHVAGVKGDDILLNFDLSGILASSGSACSSGVARPSHVILAMGYPEDVALNSVRVSFSHEVTPADTERMGAVLLQIIDRIQKKGAAQGR